MAQQHNSAVVSHSGAGPSAARVSQVFFPMQNFTTEKFMLIARKTRGTYKQITDVIF